MQNTNDPRLNLFGLVNRLVVLCYFTLLTVFLPLSSSVTFLFFDLFACIFLISLFRGRARFWFLVQPGFLFITAPGFEVLFTEIGVGFTYVTKYLRFAPDNIINYETIWIHLEDKGVLNWTGLFKSYPYLYLGSFPIQWAPLVLFNDPESLSFYFWQGAFSIICVIIPVVISKMNGGIRGDILFSIALFSLCLSLFISNLSLIQI